MIKNLRQYNITRAQMERFQETLSQIGSDSQIAPEIATLHRDAIVGQLADLRNEVTEYEALQSGTYRVMEVEAFDQLPHALIRERIAAGLTQKDLADRLHLKEQQVQQYEATDYQAASLARLQEVVRALNLHVREEIFLPSSGVSRANLLKRLREARIDAKFARALLPPALAHALTLRDADAGSMLQAASVLGRVFGWTASMLFGQG